MYRLLMLAILCFALTITAFSQMETDTGIGRRIYLIDSTVKKICVCERCREQNLRGELPFLGSFTCDVLLDKKNAVKRFTLHAPECKECSLLLEIFIINQIVAKISFGEENFYPLDGFIFNKKKRVENDTDKNKVIQACLDALKLIIATL